MVTIEVVKDDGGSKIGKVFKAIFSIHGLGLFFICFLTYGSYFTYDTPGALGYGVVCNFNNILCFDWATLPKNEFQEVKTENSDIPNFDHTICSGNCWLNETSNKWAVTYEDFTAKPQSLDRCYCPTSKDLKDPTKGIHTVPGVQNNIGDYLAFGCNRPCNGSDSNDKTKAMTDPNYYCGGTNKDKANMTHTFGTMFSYDCPTQTIQMHFKNNGKDYTYVQNNLLYSVYSFPNMILALMGGVMIDKIGLRKAALLFLTFIALGELLFVIGILSTQYWLMILGRIVFGLGGESLSVSQSAFCARWFKKTGYMAVAFGITLSFSRIGSATTFLIVPWLATKSVSTALWVGVAACCFSLVCGVVISMLDKYAESKEIIESAVDVDEPFNFRDIGRFSLQFWLIALICVFFYISVFPFNSIAKTFFHDKWQVDMVTAGGYVSVYTFFSAAGSPIVGMAMDKIGYPLLWMMTGSGIIIGAMAIMWLTTVTPILCMCMVGLAITLLGASMWPAVPYIVEKRVVGSAYGLMTSVQNIGLGTMPLLLGWILEVNKNEQIHKYYICLWLLGATGTMALALCIILMIVDKARGGVMMVSTAQRKKLESLNEEQTKLVNP